jgi:hypothetical protein
MLLVGAGLLALAPDRAADRWQGRAQYRGPGRSGRCALLHAVSRDYAHRAVQRALSGTSRCPPAVVCTPARVAAGSGITANHRDLPAEAARSIEGAFDSRSTG